MSDKEDFGMSMIPYLPKMPGYGEWTRCPKCREYHERVYGALAGGHDNIGTIHWAIMHLYDDHRWTREQIADWLETLEDIDLEFKEPTGEDIN
jgi:hypothetical protein